MRPPFHDGLEKFSGERPVARSSAKKGDMPFLYTGIARLHMVKIAVACCRPLGYHQNISRCRYVYQDKFSLGKRI